MVSIDQVLLLQQKVESAVQKIVQLKAENDALRSKCSELTNALSEKTELLEALKAEDSRIEDSIKNTIDRLSSVVISGVAENKSAKPENAAAENNLSLQQQVPAQDSTPSLQTSAPKNITTVPDEIDVPVINQKTEEINFKQEDANSDIELNDGPSIFSDCDIDENSDQPEKYDIF